MSRTPLVDVAMATYNHEKFIAQALESVLAQETDFDYRLIVGDDCSSDGTQAIIKEYARRHPGRIVTLFHPKRLGTAHRDRIGVKVLRLCTAKYVAMLDGDDFWTDPRKLQKQADYLEAHPDCALCFHNATMLFEDQSKPPRDYCPADQKEVSTLEDIAAQCFLITCTVMFRNRFLGELPECFYRVTNADWMLFVLLAEHGHFRYLNEVMATYRIHGNGVWQGLAHAERLRTHINTYRTIDEHLNFRYTEIISEKLSHLHNALSQLPEWERQQARSYLDRYHALVRSGRFSTALPLLLKATRLAPMEVLRPRRAAAVLKNGLLGALSGRKGREAARDSPDN
jgi:glycosyltransferase involved in cell wall biosynthesis